MSQMCKICSSLLSQRTPGIQCSFCEHFFHLKCVNLNKNQYDTITTTEGCIWKCTGCAKINCNTKDLIKAIENLQIIVTSLQKQIEEINDRKDVVQECDTEIIIKEISERQQRERNVILYKVPSATNAPNTDLQTANDILNSIVPDISVESVVRLGKAQGNRPPPLKVRLSNRDDVAKVLRNKRKLKDVNGYKDIIISTDRTKMQQQYFKKIQEELNNRKQNGENNLYIKFLNGTPTIATSKN